MELIDKDALVEEIERRIKSVNSCPFRTAELGSEKSDEGQLNAYNVMLSFINTLEVKEVDLDNVIENYIHENFGERWDGCVPVGCFELDSMAEHFYMLGFNARKEE